jgi:hypothetical protein
MFTIAKQITAKETSLVALFIVGVFYYIFNLSTSIEYKIIVNNNKISKK